MGRAGIAQLVERNLAKVEVAGSNPVSRSITVRGGMAKWSKAAVCKTVIHRFESDCRLQFLYHIRLFQTAFQKILKLTNPKFMIGY